MIRRIVIEIENDKLWRLERDPDAFALRLTTLIYGTYGSREKAIAALAEFGGRVLVELGEDDDLDVAVNGQGRYHDIRPKGKQDG